MSTNSVNLYDNVYGDFASEAELAERKAAGLATMFRENFAQFEGTVEDAVSAAGPRG